MVARGESERHVGEEHHVQLDVQAQRKQTQ